MHFIGKVVGYWAVPLVRSSHQANTGETSETSPGTDVCMYAHCTCTKTSCFHYSRIRCFSTNCHYNYLSDSLCSSRSLRRSGASCLVFHPSHLGGSGLNKPQSQQHLSLLVMMVEGAVRMVGAERLLPTSLHHLTPMTLLILWTCWRKCPKTSMINWWGCSVFSKPPRCTESIVVHMRDIVVELDAITTQKLTLTL